MSLLNIRITKQTTPNPDKLTLTLSRRYSRRRCKLNFNGFVSVTIG